MKQIEITVKVKNTLSEVDKILTDNGFKIIRKSIIKDEYMCLDHIKKDITKDKIIDCLNNSVLIRYLNISGNEYKKITYKEKKYDESGMVISEEKVNVSIDDISNAIKLFQKLKFDHLVSVNYSVVVYSNGEYEFAFQNVENLGLLLEFENNKDFSNSSNNQIKKEKEKMLNILKEYNLSVSEDYDINKAYELILIELSIYD